MTGSRRIIVFLFLLIITLGLPHFGPGATIRAVEAPSVSIPDISARQLSPAPDYTPVFTKPDQRYSSVYQKATRYYQNGEYEQSSILLKTITSRYKDGGKAWFLLGMCSFAIENYNEAALLLYTAKESGYDPQEADREIAAALFEYAYNLATEGDYRYAIANYKTALFYHDDPVTIQNTVYCYLNYADQLPQPDNALYILHGYDFLKTATYETETPPGEQVGNLVQNIAISLCRYIVNSPPYDLLDRGGSCIRDALSFRDDPYLHQSLGFIYLYQNSPHLAKQEFKTVIERYPDSPYYEFCLDCYRDIGFASYRYCAIYPVTVISKDAAGLLSIKAELSLLVPQNFEYQTVKIISVLFNGMETPFTTFMDNYGTKYLSLKLKEIFKKGRNELSVTCDVVVESRRISPASLSRLTLADYKTNHPRYQTLTRRTELTDTRNPQIQKMVKEIQIRAKSNQLLPLVRTVYDYVMENMSYRETAEERPELSTARVLTDMNRAVCADYALLTVTLLRALKIPASYFSGDTYNESNGHAWPVFYTPDFQPIPIDPTWGDTSGMPDLYFLAHSNQHITTSFGYDSDLWPGAASIRLSTTSDRGVSVELEQPVVHILLQE